MGFEVGEHLDGINLHFTSPNGHPRVAAVVFDVPGKGLVRI